MTLAIDYGIHGVFFTDCRTSNAPSICSMLAGFHLTRGKGGNPVDRIKLLDLLEAIALDSARQDPRARSGQPAMEGLGYMCMRFGRSTL